MPDRRRWLARPAAGLAAAAVMLIAVGCGSAASPSAGPSSSGAPAGTSPAVSPVPPTSSPAVSPGAVSPAQQEAQAVQGDAAVATSAQLAALRSQAAEIARLSPAQMAGQRVMYSFSGLSAPASLLAAIRQGEVGGVIFFGSNIASAAQLRGVIGQLDAASESPANPARGYPLLLMVDQEGGLVRRLTWAGPSLSEAQIGALADPAAAAAAAGSQAAAGLRAVGLNLNLAPVLDVYRQPGDFDDQYGRSYSMSPAVAAASGAAFVRAQQADQVAATVKHFPGLGAASAAQNTDNQPVRITLPASTLRSIDEVPFEAAITAGVKLTMVSWATYPALDPGLPAGLSPRIVQGELEDRLGFSGVTITDALGAGALGPYGSLQNKTMLAARAGMDALLCTATGPLPGAQCVAGLVAGYTDGALPARAFQAQLAQLLVLRASLK